MNRHEKALEIFSKGTVIPAIPLVLDKNRHFDEKRQRAIVRYYLDSGVGGVAVAVHTTQFEIRLPEYNLFEPVLKVTVDEMEKYEQRTGKTLVRVAGVCGKIPQAVKEAEILRKYGFDAALLSPGGLSDLSEDELIERTEAVAKIMPVIGFYLQNAVGGRRLSCDYWKRLADVPNVIGVKAAPFNRYQSLDLVRGVASSARSNEVALYTGNDDNIVVDLMTKYSFDINGKTVEKRFIGGLLGHWSVWTKKVAELYEDVKAHRDDEVIPARFLTLAAQITDANGALFDVAHNFAGCIPGVHEILRRQGLIEGTWCLNPNEVLSEGQSEEIDRIYRMYPHLTDDDFVKENLEKWLAD